MIEQLFREPSLLKQKSDLFWFVIPSFESFLENYLPKFDAMRSEQGFHVLSQKDLMDLPFGKLGVAKSWQWRQQSLNWIEGQLKQQRFEQTLEIGAWNGWLTKHLAKYSDQLVATDYFTHEKDGLMAIPPVENIIRLVADTNALTAQLKPNSFDLIVINHALQHQVDPVDFFKQSASLLRPGGVLLSIGNTFYKNPEKKKLVHAKSREEVKRNHGFDWFIHPIKGYMDYQDLKSLQDFGAKISWYSNMKLAHVKAAVDPSYPKYACVKYSKTP